MSAFHRAKTTPWPGGIKSARRMCPLCAQGVPHVDLAVMKMNLFERSETGGAENDATVSDAYSSYTAQPLDALHVGLP